MYFLAFLKNRIFPGLSVHKDSSFDICIGLACQKLEEACGKNRPLSYVDTDLDVIT